MKIYACVQVITQLAARRQLRDAFCPGQKPLPYVYVDKKYVLNARNVNFQNLLVIGGRARVGN